MRRVFAIMLACLLVAGTLVLPALHELHCHDHDGADGHDGHDSSHCPICQLVNAPVHSAVTYIAPPVEAPVGVFYGVLPRRVFAAVSRDPTQARAPPAA